MAKKDDAMCGALERREVSWVEAQLRKRYEPKRKPSKVFVGFRCDPVDEDVSRIVVESGSGHGQTLRIWELTRGADGPYEVLGIAFRWTHGSYQEYSYTVAEQFEVQFVKVELDAAKVDAVLDRTRVALLSSVTEVPLKTRSRTVSLSGSSSSNDFYRLVRLADRKGRALERHFAGYASSYTQSERLPMEIASAELLKLLRGVPWDRSETKAHRELFHRRFLTASQVKPAWWVTERYVALASRLGDWRLIPSLLTVANPSSPGDASTKRLRFQAVNGLAAVTGWDARVSAKGKPRSIGLVAGEYARECAAAR